MDPVKQAAQLREQFDHVDISPEEVMSTMKQGQALVTRLHLTASKSSELEQKWVLNAMQAVAAALAKHADARRASPVVLSRVRDTGFELDCQALRLMVACDRARGFEAIANPAATSSSAPTAIEAALSTRRLL